VTEPVRLIKRYANRKLYDTGSGELTSMRRIAELVRDGVEIRVVDHDTGQDMTSEVLVGILGNSMHTGTIEGDKSLLMSLIRAPEDLLAAMLADEQRTEELRSMGERVRVLSATIDALLNQMDQGRGGEETAPARPTKSRAAKAAPARKSTGRSRSPRS
jgi:polyhydroxyalkanoate synthesis repressor PhaR